MEKKVKLDYNVKSDDFRLAFATMNNVVNTMNKIGMLNLNIVMLNAAFTWFFNHYAETVADMAFEKMKVDANVSIKKYMDYVADFKAQMDLMFEYSAKKK